jgi:hypothetical protein
MVETRDPAIDDQFTARLHNLLDCGLAIDGGGFRSNLIAGAEQRAGNGQAAFTHGPLRLF